MSAQNRYGPRGPTGAHGFQRYRPTPAELRRLAREVPPDTRDVTGQLLGDPLPGRSALDQMRREGAE
jgi:hypothetical protein